MSHFPESFLQEFRQSAIPDRLTEANVAWVEGQSAVQLLAEHAVAASQKVSSFVGVQAQRILDKYAFAADGGWVAYGCKVDGSPNTVGYFKPQNPRQSAEFRGFGEPPKPKAIKYETPQGQEALPLMPWVDEQTAQEIYSRYSVTPREGETFWAVVYRCNLPLAVTEGLKKALCLIGQGMPALALRGICNWHPKGKTALHPALDQFATAGRKIYIVFDQDEKLSTQKAVRTQILKLGAALERGKANVSICIWDRAQGKGIDDAIFALGIQAETWLKNIFEQAFTLADYKRNAWIAMALGMIAQHNTLTYPIERSTEGEYLPKLPPIQPGKIHVLSASMNSGKTTRIGAGWVKWAISSGWNCAVLTPINNLGKQAAHDWGLPHIHSYGLKPDEQNALWADVSYSHGVVLCPDSLHRLPDWFWNRPTLLILDEANQVIDHLCQGDTLGNRYSLILEKFTAAARHAIETGAIALSEDGLPDRTVNFVKAVSGAKEVRVFKHQKQGIPWDCKVFSGQASSYRARFLEAAKQQHNRVMFVTSSQAEAARLERALRKLCPTKKVIRIDSETNQQGQFTIFFEQPDPWLQEHQPDILILSPSAKSGVSIEGGVSPQQAYFSSVWGYFPALATDTHWQLLGRYRPSVPRFIFVPDFILSSGDESLLTPRAIKRRLALNSKALAGVYGIESLLDKSNFSELQATIENAVLDYLAISTAVSGCLKSIANAALVNRLEQVGYSYEKDCLKKDADFVNLWREVKHELWREQAGKIASGKIEPEHTRDWALEKIDGLEVSSEVRILAQKVLWREEFPGVSFDDLEECYQALCYDNGAMRRGVLLQAKAENLDAAKESDRKAVEAALKGDIRAFHRLPKGYAQARLIAKSGVLELLDGQPYSNADRRCQQVKQFALRFKSEISYWLRLQVSEEQTAVQICHRLLKKLGLERHKEDRPGAIHLVDRPGNRGQNTERFSVDLSFNSVRARILEAARRKLSGEVTPICNSEQIPLIQINVTQPQGGHSAEDWLHPDALEDVRSLWEAAQTPEEQAAIRQAVPLEVLARAIA